jgi:diaminohydroxyphosphoribosylaminopyrimidine deaminase/5-amino-6-(5-phosphoribosylamino)uracil reductase
MSDPEHESFMRRAILLARRAWGETHPNPMVGALIVEDGEVVAGGYHERDGTPHAERLALADLARNPRAGATLYVTLEPCSTHGRTGACTDAIIASGIRTVVVGATDPNPVHAGRGFEVLRAAGIEVITGVLEAECADLNILFNQWIGRKQPLLAGKLAATLDGRIATRAGESKWITGEAARADVHQWRKLFPAIAVGAGTVMKDNPRLTSRIEGQPELCPIRFVFDGRLRSVTFGSMPHVYSDAFAKRTIVVTTQHGGLGYVRRLKELGVNVWTFESPTGRVPLAAFRARCASEGVAGVLFEGGAQLLSRALIEREIDYMLMYHAPVILADDRAKPGVSGLRTEKLAQAMRLADVRRSELGDDTLVRGRVVYPEKFHIDETHFSLG